MSDEHYWDRTPSTQHTDRSSSSLFVFVLRNISCLIFVYKSNLIIMLSHLSSHSTTTTFPPLSNSHPSPPCLRRLSVVHRCLIPPRATVSLSTSSEISSSSPPLRTEQYHMEKGKKTLLEFVGTGGAYVGDDLAVLLAHMQTACKRIAALVASPFHHEVGNSGADGRSSSSNSGRDAQKPLDIISVWINFLIFVNLCRCYNKVKIN